MGLQHELTKRQEIRVPGAWVAEARWDRSLGRGKTAVEGGRGEGDSREWGRGLGGRRNLLSAQGPVGPDWDGGKNRNANRDCSSNK